MVSATRRQRMAAWHAGFLAMLPAIRRQLKVAFRHLDPEARAEAVQEGVCNAMHAYLRLHERGEVEKAYPTPLAQYAARQIRDGRKVGGKLNVKDVSSHYCQRLKHVVLERLDRWDKEEGWMEVVVEDRMRRLLMSPASAWTLPPGSRPCPDATARSPSTWRGEQDERRGPQVRTQRRPHLPTPQGTPSVLGNHDAVLAERASCTVGHNEEDHTWPLGNRNSQPGPAEAPAFG